MNTPAQYTLTDLERRVERLKLPPRDYAVFGSGPLLAHGLITFVSDVDILARGAAWERAEELGTAERAPGGDAVVRLEGVEIFSGWLGMDVDAVISGAKVVNTLPFARLADVRAFKKKLGRPKDFEHVRLIEAYGCDGG